MKVRALRGVCIGVESHLQAGDVADLEAAQVTFLTSIGAVERVPDDEPVTVIPETRVPAKKPAGKKEK